MSGKKSLSFLLVGYLFFLFSSPVSAAYLKINEFLPHPSSGNKEWVELYNPDTIDVGSYYIDDDTSFTEETGSTKKQLATLSSTTASSQFPTFDLSSFLNNSGDTIALFSSDGALIDQFHYDTDPGVDISLGRSPDGTGEIAMLASPTKGGQNSPVAPSSTPTPTITPTPTVTPKPTITPKPPTSTPTPKMPSSTPVTKTLSVSPSVSRSASSALTKLAGAKDALASAVHATTSTYSSGVTLGTESAHISPSSTGKPIQKPMEKTLVYGTSKSRIPFIVMGIGAVFLSVCGILSFRIYKTWKAEV